jgi:hypothetical protein
MKVKLPKNRPKKLSGKCHHCECRVETDTLEAELLVDRDSPEGAYHVACPNCDNNYLWVK